MLPLNFMGPKAIVDGEPLAEYVKDALHLYTHGEPVDSLIQYVGLTGLQHAGVCCHKMQLLFQKNDLKYFSIPVQFSHRC